MSMLFSNLSTLDTLSPKSRATERRRSFRRSVPRVAIPWLLGLLLAAPRANAAGDLSGPRVDPVACHTGSVLLPTARPEDHAVAGPAILEISASGILEIEISTTTAAPSPWVLRPCRSQVHGPTSESDLPGLVLSVRPTGWTVFVPRPGRWIVASSLRGEALHAPLILRTRLTPWTEVDAIDLLSDTTDSDGPRGREVALLSRWTSAVTGLDADKEEDHEVDPDPSTAAPSGSLAQGADLYLLTLGRDGDSGREPLGWILLASAERPDPRVTDALATKEEDHEVDPDPSVVVPIDPEGPTLWSAWVVPASEGEALWLQWSEAVGAQGTHGEGARIVSRVLDLSQWLTPMPGTGGPVSILPSRVLPWHQATVGLVGRR